jgi:hypothetical protein
MQKVQSTAISQELQALLTNSKDGPISIESGGRSMAIVMSAQMYADMLQRCGARRPVNRRALTLDSNELFGLNGDVFCNDL